MREEEQDGVEQRVAKVEVMSEEEVLKFTSDPPDGEEGVKRERVETRGVVQADKVVSALRDSRKD